MPPGPVSTATSRVADVHVGAQPIAKQPLGELVRLPVGQEEQHAIAAVHEGEQGDHPALRVAPGGGQDAVGLEPAEVLGELSLQEIDPVRAGYREADRGLADGV